MGDKEYTLDELVSRTGFGKRQIRYYITEKLVPGAGDQRGPNAVYGEETLRRLQMIAILKDRPVGPTGRVMTLAEIRHALDHGAHRDLATVLGDHEDVKLQVTTSEWRRDSLPEISASEYLAKLASLDGLDACISGPARPGAPKAQESAAIHHFMDSCDSDGPVERSPLDELLQSLHSLLAGLGSDTRFDDTTGEGTSWRRITSPDVEIQVRTPDTLAARLRLVRMAHDLGRLLAREE